MNHHACQRYTGTGRCQRAATVKMITPGGKPSPGGRFCDEHAEALIDYCRDRYGDEWTAEPLTDESRFPFWILQGQRGQTV